MEFILICSGAWNIIFAFSKWSIEAKNRLLKTLCTINGFSLIIAGISSYFLAIDEKLVIASFYILLFMVGMLIECKYSTENHIISKCAVFLALAMVILASMMVLFAESIDDYESACVALTGSIMILSIPYTQLSDRIKSKKLN